MQKRSAVNTNTFLARDAQNTAKTSVLEGQAKNIVITEFLAG